MCWENHVSPGMQILNAVDRHSLFSGTGTVRSRRLGTSLLLTVRLIGPGALIGNPNLPQHGSIWACESPSVSPLYSRAPHVAKPDGAERTVASLNPGRQD